MAMRALTWLTQPIDERERMSAAKRHSFFFMLSSNSLNSDRRTEVAGCRSQAVGRPDAGNGERIYRSRFSPSSNSLTSETESFSSFSTPRDRLLDTRRHRSETAAQNFQYSGLNSAVRSLIVSHSFGKSGSPVPASSSAAGP